FCLAFLSVFVWVLDVSSQGRSTNDVRLPQKPNLVLVRLPDVTKLEAEVRDQMLSAQNALAAAAKDSAITDAKLGEAYGHLGQIYQAYALVTPARDCYLNAHSLSP